MGHLISRASPMSLFSRLRTDLTIRGDALRDLPSSNARRMLQQALGQRLGDVLDPNWANVELLGDLAPSGLRHEPKSAIRKEVVADTLAVFRSGDECPNPAFGICR